MPHSSTRGDRRLGGALTLPLDLVERKLIIEALTRFREKVGPRFDDCFCGGVGGVAAAIWLEERKSENEDAVCGTGCVACSAGVGIRRGLPASGELGRLSARDWHHDRSLFHQGDIPTAISTPSSTSSSGAKRCLMEGSIALIGVKRPPNSSPGSPWYARPSASLKWYLRVFES